MFYAAKLIYVHLILKDAANASKYASKYTAFQVFNSAQEAQLEQYVLKCSKINYGMTNIQIRKMAFEYAVKLDCKYPRSWDRSNIAGIDGMKVL